MDTAKLAQIIETHSGHITAQDDHGTTRVQFENGRRAGGFYDEMISRSVQVLDYDRVQAFVTIQP